MKQINIVFHHRNSWSDFSSKGFHNRSGNIFLKLVTHPNVNKLMYVHDSDFWIISLFRNNRDKREKDRSILGRFKPLEKYDKIFILENRSFLPFKRLKISNKLNVFISSFRIKRAVKILKMDSWVTWFYQPQLSDVVFHSKNGLVVYDSIEPLYSNDTDVIRKELINNYKFIADKSDIIFCVSKKMKRIFEKEFLRVSNTTFWVSNGVRFNDFQKLDNSVPMEFLNICKPMVGYVGILNPNTDFELLKYIISNRPNYSFVFVGKYLKNGCKNCLDGYRNVYLIPFKRTEELPFYISGFDVCINPCKNNVNANLADSIKLYNYLAAGKPVISTNVQMVNRFKKVIYIAKTKKDFLQFLDEAIKEKGSTFSMKRRESVKPYDWSVKVDTMIETIMNAHALK